MTPKYRIIYYNRSTDRVGGLVPIPGRHLPQVLRIAGIKNPSELGEYPLTHEQTQEIARVIGMSTDLYRFIYHLEPIGQRVA